MNYCVDVLLPLPLKECYSYLVPKDLESEVQVGKRVLVPLGEKKKYTGIILSRTAELPSQEKMKEILEVLDEEPIVTHTQLKFWRWIAEYYLTTLGEVCKAALPSAFKLESESLITLNEEAERPSFLSQRDEELLQFVQEKEKVSLQRLLKVFPKRGTATLIQRLLQKDLLSLSQEVEERFRPKMETFVRLALTQKEQDKLEPVFQQLHRAKKQTTLLMSYLHLSHFMSRGEVVEVSRRRLLEESGCSATILTTLLEKGVFEIYSRRVDSRFSDGGKIDLPPLTPLQSKAKEDIVEGFKTHNVVLLHGVTSSGKTEIYMHLIKEVLEKQKHILYLVPEIALTAQLTSRLQEKFGERLMVYHSKYSDSERARIWEELLHTHEGKVVLGVRSSIFLPLENLGLIIVDEEHETSFKQFEPAPRYHARNVAIVLASMMEVKVLLGTATPSFESYYNVQIGKYALVELFSRFSDVKLPAIEVVDTHELKRKKLMKGFLSPPLVEEMTETLDRGEQIILFQNRRGFAQMMECKGCNYVPRCEHCDVSLTYHKGLHRLVCHYCGETYPIPYECPKCGSQLFFSIGFGTEQVEEVVSHLFPSARVARMDLDTTHSRKSYTQIIQSFEQGKTDILIGTQMVAKGLDFARVSLVGILNADTLLNFPDFRSEERAFQMLQQVAGRAGRKEKQGKVIVQTSSPEHFVIQQVIGGNFRTFFSQEMEERKMFHYPPFARLIYVYMKHRDEGVVERFSTLFAESLCEKFHEGLILGPDRPMVERVQRLFIRKIVLKVRCSVPLGTLKEMFGEIHKKLLLQPAFRSIYLYYDVDPM